MPRDPEEILDQRDLRKALRIGSEETFRVRQHEGEIPEPSFYIGPSPRWFWGDVLWWIKRKARAAENLPTEIPKKSRKSQGNPGAADGP
jgi:hypothetical protein